MVDGFVRRYDTSTRHRRAAGRARARSSRARAGSRTAWRCRGATTRRASCSSACSTSATTSGCCPRSTTRSRRRMVGNFPQAFSHVSVIGTARNLSRGEVGPADRRRRPPRRGASAGRGRRDAGADDASTRSRRTSPRRRSCWTSTARSRRSSTTRRPRGRCPRRGCRCSTDLCERAGAVAVMSGRPGGVHPRACSMCPKLEVVGLYGLSATPPLDDDVRSAARGGRRRPSRASSSRTKA